MDDPVAIDREAERREESQRIRHLVCVSLLVAVVLGVAVTWVSADHGPDPALAALRTDPMATYVPPGATLTERREGEAGSAMGMGHPATVDRHFSVPAERAAEAYAATVRAARRGGWRLNEYADLSRTTPGPDGSADWLGDRSESDASMEVQPRVLTIRVGPDLDGGAKAPPDLYIGLGS